MVWQPMAAITTARTAGGIVTGALAQTVRKRPRPMGRCIIPTVLQREQLVQPRFTEGSLVMAPISIGTVTARPASRAVKPTLTIIDVSDFRFAEASNPHRPNRQGRLFAPSPMCGRSQKWRLSGSGKQKMPIAARYGECRISTQSLSLKLTKAMSVSAKGHCSAFAIAPGRSV